MHNSKIFGPKINLISPKSKNFTSESVLEIP